MTNEEKKRLERNLTRSASRAKEGYVRIKTGPLAEDQGYAALDFLPIFNPLRGQESSLSVFMEDVQRLSISLDTAFKDIEELKSEQREKDIEIKALKGIIEKIDKRVKDIELFDLD